RLRTGGSTLWPYTTLFRSDRHDDVGRGGGDGGEGELPLETEPNVNEDGAHRDEHRDGALGRELARNLRADGLDAPHFVGLVGESRTHLLDRGLLRGVSARLLLDAHEHVVGRAELLHLDFAKTQTVERFANMRRVGVALAGILQLDRRAADEVDPQIEAFDEGRTDGAHRDQDREDD